MSTFVSTFMQGLLYRGREGHLSYLGHRLAGLGTLLFLAVHILDTSTVYFFPDLYSHAIDIYRSTPFMLGEILLVAAVIYHGVNGLKIILYDLFPQWWTKTTERQSFWRVMGLTVILWAPAAYLMGRALYLHNICHCPPPPPAGPRDLTSSLIGISAAFIVILAVLAFGGSLNPTATSPTRAVAVPTRNLETWSWLFMRWSGALLVPLAWGHILIQDILVGVHAIDLDYVALRWATTAWRVYDIALLAFAFGHGMNGLRGIVDDYIQHRGWNRAIKWAMLLGWIALSAIGAVAVVGGVRK